MIDGTASPGSGDRVSVVFRPNRSGTHHHHRSAQALALRDKLADLIEPEHLVESRFEPVLGTHLGPNTIGVAVTQRNTGNA